MADRVSASIRIGGALAHESLEDLLAVIADEGLSTDWDGAEFTASDLPSDGPLELMAREVSWGRFETLEQYCITHHLPFARWSGAYIGGWEAERLVFDGSTDPRSYMVTESDHVVITRAEARALGSIEAIEGHFAAADFAVPPLVIVAATRAEGGDHG